MIDIDINIKYYKIVKCSNCHNFVITSAKKYFKCSICNKNQDISKKKIFFKTDNPLIAKEVLIKIKEESFKKNNKFKNDDFLDANNV